MAMPKTGPDAARCTQGKTEKHTGDIRADGARGGDGATCAQPRALRCRRGQPARARGLWHFCAVLSTERKGDWYLAFRF